MAVILTTHKRSERMGPRGTMVPEIPPSRRLLVWTPRGYPSCELWEESVMVLGRLHVARWGGQVIAGRRSDWILDSKWGWPDFLRWKLRKKSSDSMDLDFGSWKDGWTINWEGNLFVGGIFTGNSRSYIWAMFWCSRDPWVELKLEQLDTQLWCLEEA